MKCLISQGDGIWTADQDFSAAGMNLNIRSTVIQLEDTSLLVYSPIRMNEELKTDLASLGEVKILLAPNLFHHTWANDWQEAYPTAALFGSRGLELRTGTRKSLRVVTELRKTKGNYNSIRCFLFTGAPLSRMSGMTTVRADFPISIE